jgi:protein tyrosine phosphatase (PTP) superfamily phosphohydrolase (DUF442 family)
MSLAPRRAAALTLALLVVIATGCAGATDPEAPLDYAGTAYELAGAETLDESPPQELPGLHNVYRLSGQIISGSEPQGIDAFAQLADMGVKTILSVDGKRPDADTAAQHGLRYVHIPIQYKGIADDELAAITKTFRELEGPFYVHCFHGRHRGPAAAAVGRVVVDGASRQTALAEMRQWCGTAEEYEGLYATVASAPLPDADATATLAFDFPVAHTLEGVRGVMIPVPRAHDNLKALAKRGWATDPEHPDVDPLNEAEILAELFDALQAQPDSGDKPDDYQAYMQDARSATDQLVEALRSGRDGLSPHDTLEGEPRERADAAMAGIKTSCKSCHAGYRDN